MPWLQLKIETHRPHVPALEELLESLGAAAIVLQDAGNQPLLEPPPGATPLWDHLWLQGIFTVDSDAESLLEFLDQHYAKLIIQRQIELLEDKDWERAWMDHYHPMRFGHRLWVVPSWTPPPQPEAVNLLLDPGLAFGTGTHATTALCLEWLDSLDLHHKTVMDYGCGSGILAIAALLLGADTAYAVDNDPQALTATLDNAQRNQVDERLRVLAPAEIPVDFLATVDVVVANILARPLIALAPRLLACLRPGGAIALSGLIGSQCEEVQATYAPYVDFSAVAVRDEDWCRLNGTRNNRTLATHC